MCCAVKWHNSYIICVVSYLDQLRVSYTEPQDKDTQNHCDFVKALDTLGTL